MAQTTYVGNTMNKGQGRGGKDNVLKAKVSEMVGGDITPVWNQIQRYGLTKRSLTYLAGFVGIVALYNLMGGKFGGRIGSRIGGLVH
jgi:hypothetical protein